MAGNMSDAAEELALKFMFSDATVVRPTSWAMALYTVAPTDAGGGTEVSNSLTGYARQPFVPNANGTANATDIVYGPSVSDWGVIVAVAIFDQTGRMLLLPPVDAPIDIPAGQKYTFPAGTIQLVAD